MLDIHSEISAQKNNQHSIRGIPLLDLIQKRSLVEVLFLLWRGDFPKPKERQLLEAALVASVEHGVEAPSVFVARVVVSTGNPLNAALAASALTIGEKHGGAIEAAARLFQESSPARHTVEQYLAQYRVIPGFGHKIYTNEDPRATLLYKKAKKLGFSLRFFKKAYGIERELLRVKGKKLPLNIDGALAAVLLELHFDPGYGKAFFIIPRLIGAAAHAIEEQKSSSSYHRLAAKK